ncbi:hypothetical protein A2U01_0012522, partial [Trifolium medium]|nr:hypothetical protein [Trifolium medium]
MNNLNQKSQTNVMESVQVADFGVARLADAANSNTHVSTRVMGTFGEGFFGITLFDATKSLRAIRKLELPGLATLLIGKLDLDESVAFWKPASQNPVALYMMKLNHFLIHMFHKARNLEPP